MKKNKNILIIGVGSIGKRHLESILRLKYINIYLIDNSETSLNLSKKIIYNQNKNKLQVAFFTKIEQIIPKIDLCIVATNSIGRKELILKLINNISIKYLILEKIVFNKINDFDFIIKKLNNNKINSWVNYSRRYDNLFKKIKNDIKNIDTVLIEVAGGKWGLGSNSVHFIDLLFFFKNDFKLKIVEKKLFNRIYKSKRNGYFEFGGTIVINSNKGDKIKLTDTMKNNDNLILKITYNKETYIFDYNKGLLKHLKNKILISSNKFTPIFQSNITNKIVEDIFKSRKCSLATLGDSKKSHKVLIDYLNEHSNKLHKTKKIIYPVT
jgi:hypothetical protein